MEENEIIDAPVVEPKLTIADLGVSSGKVAKPLWSADQFVEPERDGQPWCTQEDAEDMLVRAAKPMFVGMLGKQIKTAELSFAEGTSVLTLKLG